MDKEKQMLIEQFIIGCQKLGLSLEESTELAAKNLIGVVSASGKSHARIEVKRVGIVEVEC
ncbi:hypothetical protein [Vibrio sp. THAF190c]|uniref:hypothetical protein n=1 Tax=Vibrio sp. THAF190c TaxID=2587865 RepID=UPI0012681AB4|nr:hypothetical protein [Vibrio sp. THAF190c]QFT13326.1 hypothetical protein FIV04_25585 [Vibrio sp. THAF190c]